MRRVLFIIVLISIFNNSLGQTNGHYNIVDYGAVPNDNVLDTEAIQKAIDKCSILGGTVIIPPGEFLSGSLDLRNNVEIYLQRGSLILGSKDINDYNVRIPKLKSYNDAFLKHSLFYAEKLENISIRGEGTIDGQGSAYKVTTKVKPDRYKNRPFIIRFIECKNVNIEGITLRNSAMWMQQYLACEDLIIRGIKVFNHANQNNDMIDIDGCKNVIMSDCIGDTDDDGITLKSTSPYINENIVITNCIVSSHCNALKLGTESTGGFKNISISNIVVKPSAIKTCIFGYPEGESAITLGMVDGGILEGVSISNINIDGVQVPIYMRLGNRARKHKSDAPEPGVGTFKDVSVSNIIARNAGPIGCSISGIPGHFAERISLNNIKIMFKGSGTIEDSKRELPEIEDHYPASKMWGTLPAYGFFVRHVKDISFSDINLEYEADDFRPAFNFEDVIDCRLSDVTLETNPQSESVIVLNKVKGFVISHSKVLNNNENFISAFGESEDIFILDNFLGGIKNIILQKNGEVKNIIENNNIQLK